MEQLQASPSLLVASDVPQRAHTEGQRVRTTPFFCKRMYCSNYVRMQISFAIRNAEVSVTESAKCIGIIWRCVPFRVKCTQYRSFRIKESPLREVPLYHFCMCCEGSQQHLPESAEPTTLKFKCCATRRLSRRVDPVPCALLLCHTFGSLTIRMNASVEHVFPICKANLAV